MEMAMVALILAQTEPVIELGLAQVLMLLGPAALVVGMSVWLRLGQAGRVTIATVRAVVQLLAVGLIIGWVFGQNTWYWVIGLLAVMLLIAGATAGGRSAACSAAPRW
jgi:putative ABC transport system permease protein